MVGSKKILLIILCLMLIPSNPVVAERNDTSMMLTVDTPVWSDDFADNSSLDNWDISGLDENGMMDGVGEFEIISGKLEATDETAETNIATHSSSVLFGTWSFDVYLPSDSQYEMTSIMFIADDVISLFIHPFWMRLDIIHTADDGATMTIQLNQFVTNNFNTISEATSTYVMNAKLHFDIIRSVSGNVYVYLDSDLLMSAEESLNFDDNDNLSYWTGAGGKLDNIAVYDTVLFDNDAPKIDTNPDTLEVEYETDFRYDFNATDDSDIIWSVDDTVNFAIDNDGIITNIVDLERGTYDIKVTVTDTVGKATSLDFTLTVAKTSGLPIPAEIFFATLILIPVVKRKLKT